MEPLIVFQVCIVFILLFSIGISSYILTRPSYNIFGDRDHHSNQKPSVHLFLLTVQQNSCLHAGVPDIPFLDQRYDFREIRSQNDVQSLQLSNIEKPYQKLYLYKGNILYYIVQGIFDACTSQMLCLRSTPSQFLELLSWQSNSYGSYYCHFHSRH